MSGKQYLWPCAIVVGVFAATSYAVRSTLVSKSAPGNSIQHAKLVDAAVVDRIESELVRLWDNANLQPAAPADDLTVLRRLSLALHGTIPSLEELREFESDDAPQRIERWTDRMLEDPRFSDYFAERLARSYVGVENGQFLIFRRDRFINWLSTQLKQQRPYDEIVSELISGRGVWTGNGEVNFLTSGFADDEFDANKLTARSVRAFLGQRMDCAQCHDHPFDHWKQSEFEGLAAHFAQVQLSLAGVVDGKKKEHVVEDTITLEERTVAPSVPFHPEWLGKEGSRRDRLARWITHPENERFGRAASNRVWALIFGRPFLVDRPVDDLPDPDHDPDSVMLDLLGAEFRRHDYDLRHLVRLITSSQAFRMSSVSPYQPDDQAALIQNEDISLKLMAAEERWAVFPLVRLRPEQVIGAMLQANNIRTIDQNSHLIIRAMKFFRERDFVDEFGDPGVEELQDRSGTIPQALLRMNGEFARDLTEANPFFAPGRISATASSTDTMIETVYLCCLTRRPTTVEKTHFHEAFESGTLSDAVEDLFWILFNSPEFSWNH